MKKKLEFVARAIPNFIFFTTFGILFSIIFIPREIRNYLSFMGKMHKDVWLSELRWDLCDKYDGCEWGEPFDARINQEGHPVLLKQVCKFCKNFQWIHND
jgi:hypothetical protein